ncbi:prepilin peptidase [Candidatus Pacearchaeota archaeon]|nr:prepilin peptidase [Candidatus Pacearchaeota archaeon]
MADLIFIFLLALVWLIFAVIQDLKTREIANWLNISLIIFALSFRFFYSLFSENFSFFYQGLIGVGIFFVMANLLYYGKFFAGGDAKLMMAFGAILPFSESFSVNLNIFLMFFFIFFIVGALYTIFSTIYLSFSNFYMFKKEFSKIFKKNKKRIYLAFIFGLILMIFGFWQEVFFILGILIFLLPYFYVYVKSVDEACLVKEVKTSQLREGDWLYKNVKIDKKIIRANWNGLTKQEIISLKKKYKTILIRYGVPFSPVFVISFLIVFYFWKTSAFETLWSFLGNSLW